MQVMLRNMIKYDKYDIMKTIINECFVSGSTLIDVLLNGNETLVMEEKDLDFFCYSKTKLRYKLFTDFLKQKNIEHTVNDIKYGLVDVYSVKIPNIVDGIIINLIFPKLKNIFNKYETINKTITKFDMQICSVAYVYKENTIYTTRGFVESINKLDIKPTKFLIDYFYNDVKLVDGDGAPRRIAGNYVPFVTRYIDRVKKYNKYFNLKVSPETEQLLNIIIKALKKDLA